MINAGIVGLGWWGRGLVDAVQGKSDQIRFVAASTRTRSDKGQRYSDRQGIDLRGGLDDLLNDPAIDAIALARPHSLHRARIEAAARAGKHVFVEMPLTLTRADAEASVAAMAAARKVHGLGFQRRFHPAMAALRDKVRAGGPGTVLQITCTPGAPLNLTLSGDHWRSDASEAPGGALTKLGVHAIDAIIDLPGEVESVYCASRKRAESVDSDDTTALMLHLASGAVAQVAAMVATGLNYRFMVFGTKGWEAISGYPEFTDHEFQPVGHPLECRAGPVRHDPRGTGGIRHGPGGRRALCDHARPDGSCRGRAGGRGAVCRVGAGRVGPVICCLSGKELECPL